MKKLALTLVLFSVICFSSLASSGVEFYFGLGHPVAYYAKMGIINKAKLHVKDLNLRRKEDHKKLWKIWDAGEDVRSDYGALKETITNAGHGGDIDAFYTCINNSYLNIWAYNVYEIH